MSRSANEALKVPESSRSGGAYSLGQLLVRSCVAPKDLQQNLIEQRNEVLK